MFGPFVDVLTLNDAWETYRTHFAARKRSRATSAQGPAVDFQAFAAAVLAGRYSAASHRTVTRGLENFADTDPSRSPRVPVSRLAASECLSPIVVWRRADGRRVLLDGAHRTRAAGLAGAKIRVCTISDL